MNTRRSFFKQLAGTLAGAVVAPQILARVSPDAFKWKSRPSGLYGINPEWRDAPYELGFYFHVDQVGLERPDSVTPIMFRKDSGSLVEFQPKGYSKAISEPIPFRFVMKDGVYSPVPYLKRLA